MDVPSCARAIPDQARAARMLVNIVSFTAVDFDDARENWYWRVRSPKSGEAVLDEEKSRGGWTANGRSMGWCERRWKFDNGRALYLLVPAGDQRLLLARYKFVAAEREFKEGKRAKGNPLEVFPRVRR